MKPRVLICVLCGPEREQWIAPPLAARLIEATRAPDVEVRLVFGVYGYAAARNRAAEMFLETSASVLCMLDNDTIPRADFVPRALLCQGDIVALPYYIRTQLDNPGNSLLCVGWHHATEPNFFTLPIQMEGGWREVDAAGAGCMFVRRSVFSKLPPPYFSIPATTPPQRI